MITIIIIFSIIIIIRIIIIMIISIIIVVITIYFYIVVYIYIYISNKLAWIVKGYIAVGEDHFPLNIREILEDGDMLWNFAAIADEWV